MRAVVADNFDGIDALSIRQVAAPTLAPGTVRIDVHAAGVSFANLLVIRGLHQNRATPPFTPGTEIAGVVTQIGPDADTSLQLGDRVFASVASGGFAEQAVVPVDNVYAIPPTLSFDGAVWFPTIYATTYAALVQRARLQPGEVLLVHGAAGATGLAAVEIGRAAGARVIATASRPEKRQVVQASGADHVIDYTTHDFAQVVRDLTGGRGADVVFDPVGGDVFDRSLRCVAPLARLIPIGFASGRIPQIPANLVLVKNLTVIGVNWGFYMAWDKFQANEIQRTAVRSLYRELLELFERGALHCRVEAALPLTRFAQALRLVEGRKVIGKVVLRPLE